MQNYQHNYNKDNVAVKNIGRNSYDTITVENYNTIILTEDDAIVA
jgi:hypothetical protein